MTIAIFSVLLFSVVQVGGTGAVLDNARALPGYLALDASYVEATGDSEPYSLLHILTTVSWCLGYLGMPHFLLRFMAIEDENKLTLSRRVASVGVTISMALVEVIGIAGCAMSAKGLLPAFLTGILVIVTVSLLTKKPSARIEAEFDLATGHEMITS